MKGLLAALMRAFPDEPLALSRAFEGTVYLDEERLRSRFEARLWPELVQRDLVFHADALAFLTAPAYVALLPAFLRAVLEPTEALDTMPFALVSSLTPSQQPRKHAARIALLTASQRQVTAQALMQLASQPDYLVRETASAALESF